MSHEAPLVPGWQDPGPSVLDVLYPYAGPCAFCGGSDKRHRMADAITENVRAGDSVRLVADGYGVPVEAVERLVAEWVCPDCDIAPVPA